MPTPDTARMPRPASAPAVPTVAVMPLRFSADPAAEISFLRTLGLHPLVTSDGEGFAVLAAPGGGRVMVHGTSGSATGAPAGETQLCLAVDEVDPLVDALRARGVEARVWDETYGRQGSLVGPHGEGIALNEQQRDLYGYQGHERPVGEDAVAEGLAVVAVRSSAPGAAREADLVLFAALGGRALPGDEGYQRVVLPGGGEIGLHAPMPDLPVSRPGDDPGFGDPALVDLAVVTDEDLDALATRLRASGYRAALRDDAGIRAVHVTDPDGQEVEIHPVGP